MAEQREISMIISTELDLQLSKMSKLSRSKLMTPWRDYGFDGIISRLGQTLVKILDFVCFSFPEGIGTDHQLHCIEIENVRIWFATGTLASNSYYAILDTKRPHGQTSLRQFIQMLQDSSKNLTVCDKGEGVKSLTSEVESYLNKLKQLTIEDSIHWNKSNDLDEERYATIANSVEISILVLIPEMVPTTEQKPVIFRLESPLILHFSPGTLGHDIIFELLATKFSPWRERYEECRRGLNRLRSILM